MARSRVIRFVLALILCTAGCGGKSTPRRLLDMKISPTTANNVDFPHGVQFSVVATYNTAPQTQVPPAVAWEVFPGLIPPPGVTVDQNGFAQCLGFVGTAPVGALAPFDPAIGLSQVRPGKQTDPSLYFEATARLTCS